MYIIKHNFNQEIPYYVRVVGNETLEEIYNPNFATLFNTEKEALDFINTYSPLAAFSEVVKSKDAIDAYDKWVNSGAVRRTIEYINTTKSRPYNGESLDEVIDWWVYVRLNPDRIKKYECYKTWPQLLQMSKHLVDVEGYHNQDYSELYITFQIYTSQNGKFEEFNEELNRVMDKVTYKDDDGYLIFPVLDHYLSEGDNSVCLLIHPETKQVEIGSHTFSSQREEFSSLEDAFNYMKKERYYDI
jgi:hypothetical protein